jgi:hypothetical protein
LSLSIAGVPLHTRSLTTVASLREDARWDVRGDVIDLRKCGFVPMTHDIQPSGIIHHMTIRLIVDPETLRIDSLQTEQPHVAIEPSDRTAGECCRDPASRLGVLEGQVLDDDFARRLSETFGGPLGCSHMLTLFFAMAAALPRAIAHEREIAEQYEEKREPGERLFWRSIFIDGYELEGGELELSVQLSDVHSGPHHQVRTPIDRLDRHEEARVVARVAAPGFTLSQVRASQRVRRLPDLAEAIWDESSHELTSLVGHPIVPGLSKKVRVLLGERPERALVRDALLQLAPGHIQVLAAITDRWFVRAQRTESDAGESSDRPPVGAIGGMVNSCYMWRAGSPLIAERESVYQARRNELEKSGSEGGADS